MVSVNVVTRAALDASTERALAVYRHGVFVKRLGWSIPTLDTEAEVERDQFDHACAVYVIRQDADQRINGCARLLPTNQPYLLETVFPQLFDADELPRSHLVWEMSRLAVGGLGGESPASRAEFLVGLRAVLKAAVDFGLANGIERYISVSFVSMERLLRRLGLHTHRAGVPAIIGGEPVVAFWVDLDDITLQALGCDGYSHATQ